MSAGWRDDYRAWGGTVAAPHLVSRPATAAAAARAVTGGGASVLGYGNGRSYGDAPLNPHGRLVDCRGLDRFIAFDRDSGVLACEAGVQLADILAVLCRPEPDGGGWLLPVTPGTRFVTVGGAIAHDVHGKNHHRFGSFGRHVVALDLARSDGRVLCCSAQQHPELFAATIGGLGLTGLILRARLRLRRVAGLAVEAEDIRFGGLAEYFALARESDADWEYTAAWIDATARGAALGRGIFSRARHVAGRGTPPPPRTPLLAVPLTPPVCLLTRRGVAAFNAVYWRRLGRRGRRRRTGSYSAAFYPLDALGGWNRLYGPRGFYQFQCLVPPAAAAAVLAELLGRVAAAGQASMLTTLKLFGDLPSPGLLSFPAPGATLALDIPNRGAATRALLAELERLVVQAGGRLYAAKDALMTAESFRAGYPGLDRFLRQVDPGFASGLARRVGIVAPAAPEPAVTDPLSQLPTVAIFGATSDIAAAVARRYAAQGWRLLLAGRDAAALAALQADLAVRGAAAVAVLEGDFAVLAALPALAEAAWQRFGGLDVALLAHGTAAQQEAAERDAAVTAAVLTINLTSAAILLNALAGRFQAQGHGTLAAITSVAGDRGRRSNYVYGAAKAGLQTLLEGLRHRLARHGVAVVDIRPGFVATRMTAHLDRRGPLWATPDRVAGDIVAAIAARRAVRYTPGYWRLIMLVVRSLPRALFHRSAL